MASETSHRVYGTGLLTLDLILRPGDQEPARWFAGGTCGNVLVILSFLGWKSFPITRLNGDIASQIVRHDLEHWGVDLEYAALAPQVSTPIIVQRIYKNKSGKVMHRFSCNCPYCGSWLPSFMPVRNDTAIEMSANWKPPTVFFFDRVSRGMITLARAAADVGALVVFEPSTKGDFRHMQEALQIAHIVKYSDQRFPQTLAAMEVSENTMIEIQTQGSEGFRYRSKFEKRARNWKKEQSLQTTIVADSAGAGDWFTAALISQFSNGLDDLLELRTGRLREVLDYANSVAGWSCFFEGARGGMYEVSKREFPAQIRELQGGHTEVQTCGNKSMTNIDEIDLFPACPAC